MNILLKPEKEFYTAQEAADALNISLDRLHILLDLNIFNDGKGKPVELHFRATDLVMLGFWHRSTGDAKVVRMPSRR